MTALILKFPAQEIGVGGGVAARRESRRAAAQSNEEEDKNELTWWETDILLSFSLLKTCAHLNAIHAAKTLLRVSVGPIDIKDLDVDFIWKYRNCIIAPWSSRWCRNMLEWLRLEIPTRVEPKRLSSECEFISDSQWLVGFDSCLATIFESTLDVSITIETRQPHNSFVFNTHKALEGIPYIWAP